MTELRGMLRKMKTELAEVVNYTLLPDQGGFRLMIFWVCRYAYLLLA